MKRSGMLLLGILPAVIGVWVLLKVLSNARPTLAASSQPGLVELAPMAQFGGAYKALAVQGNIAYVVIGPRLVVLNVSDLQHPILITETSPVFGGATWIRLSGAFAYLDGGGYNINALNISDPARPVLSGRLDVVDDTYDAAISGNYAYLANSYSGLRIIDISDPGNLHEAGYFDTPGYALGVAISGTVAYVADNTAVRVINVANPASPFEIASHSVAAAKILLDESYTYVVGGNSDFTVFTTTQISQPGQVYQCPICFGGNSPTQMAYQDHQLYLALGRYYLMKMDVSNPNQPVGSSLFGGGFSCSGAAAAGSRLYWTDQEKGFYGMDFASHQLGRYHNAPGSLSNIRYSYSAGMAVRNDLLYAPNGMGLEVLDVHDPLHPLENKAYPFWNDGTGANLVVQGNYAYANGINTNLIVMDISNPLVVAKIAQSNYGSFAGDIEAQGNYVYIGSWSTLSTFDLTQHANPVRKGVAYIPSGGVSDVEIYQNYAFVPLANAIDLFDISSHMTPTLVMTFSLSGVAGLDTYDHYAYLVRSNELQVRDVGNPYAFSLVNTLPIDGYGYFIFIQSGYAFVTTYTGTHVYDLSTPSAPRYVAFSPLRGAASVHDNVLYLGAGGDGLYALWFFIPVRASIPTSGGSLISARDQTTYTLSSGTFSEPITLTHNAVYPGDLAPLPGMKIAGHAFEIQAANAVGAALQPDKPYQISITYTDHELGAIDEARLALYAWDDLQKTWIKEPTSAVDVSNNRLSAEPSHFSIWALMGPVHRLFLPLTGRP